jgi:hypothetical protein
MSAELSGLNKFCIQFSDYEMGLLPNKGKAWAVI